MRSARHESGRCAPQGAAGVRRNDQAAEAVRDQRGLPWIEGMADFKYAFAPFAGTPGSRRSS